MNWVLASDGVNYFKIYDDGHYEIIIEKNEQPKPPLIEKKGQPKPPLED